MNCYDIPVPMNQPNFKLPSKYVRHGSDQKETYKNIKFLLETI